MLLKYVCHYHYVEEVLEYLKVNLLQSHFGGRTEQSN